MPLCQQKEDSYHWHRHIRVSYDGEINILHMAEICDSQRNILSLHSDVVGWLSLIRIVNKWSGSQGCQSVTSCEREHQTLEGTVNIRKRTKCIGVGAAGGYVIISTTIRHFAQMSQNGSLWKALEEIEHIMKKTKYIRVTTTGEYNK